MFKNDLYMFYLVKMSSFKYVMPLEELKKSVDNTNKDKNLLITTLKKYLRFEIIVGKMKEMRVRFYWIDNDGIAKQLIFKLTDTVIDNKALYKDTKSGKETWSLVMNFGFFDTATAIDFMMLGNIFMEIGRAHV